MARTKRKTLKRPGVRALRNDRLLQSRALNVELARIADDLEICFNASEANDKNRTCREWFTILALVAAGFAAFGSDMILYRQLNDARDAALSQHNDTVTALSLAAEANKQASEGAKAAQRSAAASESQATIDRAHIWIQIAPDSVRHGVSTNNNMPYVVVGFKLINYGRSPAIVTGFNSKMLLDNGSLGEDEPDPILDGSTSRQQVYMDPNDLDTSAYGIASLHESPSNSGELALPYQSPITSVNQGEVFYKRFEFSPSQISHLTNPLVPEEWSHIWVLLSYKDIYGVDRRTSIYVETEGGRKSDHHSEYNCFDDLCPTSIWHLPPMLH